MDCRIARQALLEVDPQTLSALGTDALSDHLRTCAKCARVAALLGDAQTELASHLDYAARTEPPPALVDEVLRRSRVTEPERPLLTPRRRVLASLLAAAAVAALLVWPDDRPSTSGTVGASAEAAAPAPPRVEAPAGSSVAVIQTRNPSITVVWLFSGGD